MNAEQAKENDLTLIDKQEHIKLWHSKAVAVIVSKKISDELAQVNDKPLIVVNNADLAIAKILELFSVPYPEQNGIHEKAVIDPTAKIGKMSLLDHGHISVKMLRSEIITINMLMYISTMMQKLVLWPSVTIRNRTIIGHFCRLYSNCSIGSDDFGYRPSEEGKTIVRIPHNGNVVIGSFVDIGSNTCIDNAKYGSTIIGDYTKIDNLCSDRSQCNHRQRLYYLWTSQY